MVLLAEAWGKAGQPEEGLQVLAEAFAVISKGGECDYEAELYRLKGELILQQQPSRRGPTSKGKTRSPAKKGAVL
jgi:hypothetical protein